MTDEPPQDVQGKHTDAPRSAPDFPIVGIGASAGGLDALRKLFAAMPGDSGIGFVLVQHLDPTHESLMADLLAKCTALKVVQVADGMPVEPNCLHVIPPNASLTIERGILYLAEPFKRRGMRMPIDRFFSSLADDQQERAICIVLSGTGSDGTLGLKEIKYKGGLAMVQDPATAQHDGMPRSAIATGLVDCVLALENIPETLVRYVRHSYIHNGGQPQPLEKQTRDHLQTILSLLQTRTGHDFRCYKKTTLLRRIQRRMGLNHLERYADYPRLLRDNPDEVRALVKDLLISVTSFFREPEVWQTVQEHVIPALLKHYDGRTPVRVWVPGCATGEEAYTIAMLLLEQMEARQQHCNLQLFATDLDKDALEFARAGLYPESITANVSAARLGRFFTKQGEGYQVGKQLRELVVFAPQNLVSDPPFSRLDLISCRNLLIYLEPELQNKLIALFHFSLREGGFMVLGNSETVGRQQHLFHTVSKKWRVYRRQGARSRNPLDFPLLLPEDAPRNTPRQPRRPPLPDNHVADLARKLLLRLYAPAAVIIDHTHQVLYFQGPTDRYLSHPDGHPTADLLALAREGLHTRLRMALYRVQRSGQTTSVTAYVKRDDTVLPVQITVVPAGGDERVGNLLLVCFQDRPGPVPTDAERGARERDDTDATLRSLEEELKTTREELQSTIEELVTSNEELKTSNEEAMSMNEELQSTNEELETSKEELQSLNEELTTLNNQLEDKVAELEATGNDLSNLLNSTHLATVFLDTRFHIKWFSPATRRLSNLIPGDVGRPFADIARNFNDTTLLTDARTVLEHLSPLEKDIQTDDGHWYIRRILPYRTQDNRIEGVVVTFADVTALKRSEQALRESEQRFRLLSDSAPVMIWMSDPGGGCSFFNRGWLEFTGRSLEQEQGDGWSEGLHPDDHDGVLETYRAAFERRQPFKMEYRLRRADGVYRWLLDEGRPRLAADGGFLGYIGSCVDITERKSAEEQIAVREERLRRAVLEAPLPVILFAEDGEILLISREWTALSGYTPEEIPTIADWTERAYGQRHQEIKSWIDKVFRQQRRLREGEFTLRSKHGPELVWEFNSAPLGKLPDGRRLVIAMAVDMTARNRDRAEIDRLNRELRERLNELQILLNTAPVGIAVARDRDCNDIIVNPAAARMLGVEPGSNASLSGPDSGNLPFRVFRDGRPLAPRDLPIQQAAARDEEVRDLEIEVARADGCRLTLLINASPLHDDNGQVRGCIGVLMDISARKRTEQALRDSEAKLKEQARQLAEADRRKDEFLAILAHELRNPLTPIRNSVELLKRHGAGLEGITAQARDLIDRQSRHLNRLVDDLLDVARITRGRINLRREPMDLRESIQDAMATIRPLAETGSLEVIQDLPAETLPIQGDAARLSQVIANLLSNAVKFTQPGGHIRLTAGRQDGWAELRVLDDGAGIDPTILPRIFERFYQEHNALGRAHGGLGLGLTLVKSLVDLHGGQVTAHSDGPGQGSEFMVRLPLADTASDHGAAPADRTEAAPSRNILVVDDNVDLANSLVLLLEVYGHRVRAVHDGPAALEAVRHDRPDAVLLDIGLPGMHGYEVARRLRQAFDPPPLLIALTGYGQDKDLERAREAGFHHHLLKPMDIGQLQQLLATDSG